MPFATARSVLLWPAVWLAACGGSGGSFVGSTGVPTLTVSASELALSVNRSTVFPALTGRSRRFMVTNTGHAAAQSVGYTVGSVLPVGTTIASTCTALAPGASCTITVTPGATPTTAPLTLSIGGASTSTNTLTVQVHVLDYGSVYQGGYVFAIDDTTPRTGSVGGKVMGKNDEWGYWSLSNDVIAGIDEQSLAPCAGARDGACNTAAVLAYYTQGLGVDPSTYVAGHCALSTDEGYSDWYLPAICELGFDEEGRGSGCGTSPVPTQQTMYSQLFRNGEVGGLGGLYWSSTKVAASAVPFQTVWMQAFKPLVASIQFTVSPLDVERMRCVRAITY